MHAWQAWSICRIYGGTFHELAVFIGAQLICKVEKGSWTQGVSVALTLLLNPQPSALERQIEFRTLASLHSTSPAHLSGNSFSFQELLWVDSNRKTNGESLSLHPFCLWMLLLPECGASQQHLGFLLYIAHMVCLPVLRCWFRTSMTKLGAVLGLVIIETHTTLTQQYIHIIVHSCQGPIHSSRNRNGRRFMWWGTSYHVLACSLKHLSFDSQREYCWAN